MPPPPHLAILLALALLCLAALAGCGDDEGSETPATTTTTGATGAGGGTEEDAQAKADARSAQVALETYAVDNNGSYEGADPNDLDQIQPVTSGVGVKATRDAYAVTATSNSGNTFTIERSSDGSTTKTCEQAGIGGCPENGEW